VSDNGAAGDSGVVGASDAGFGGARQDESGAGTSGNDEAAGAAGAAGTGAGPVGATGTGADGDISVDGAIVFSMVPISRVQDDSEVLDPRGATAAH
jgi:hypothetical protein